MRRVVFLSASQFGKRCLTSLLNRHQSAWQVCGLVTLPREFQISYARDRVRNVLHADFSSLATEHGLPVHVMEGGMKNPEVESFIRQSDADLAIALGWYHLIPRFLLEQTPFVGMHASLLPRYAGGAPLVWALINGENETGVTLFRFNNGVDEGPILDQAREAILRSDTIETLYERIERAGVQLLDRFLSKPFPDSLEGRVPNGPVERFPQRSPDDGQIDWNWSNERIYNFVRAQTHPYPGAFCRFKGEKLTIWKTEDPSSPQESKLNWNYRYPSSDGETSIGIQEVEFRGERMSGEDFRYRYSQGGAHCLT